VVRGKNSSIRIFPIIIGITAAAVLTLLARYRKCALMNSLGSFTLSLTLFLLLITVFYGLKKYIDFDIKKVGAWIYHKLFEKIINKIKSFLLKRGIIKQQETNETLPEAEKTDAQGESQSGSPGEQFNGLMEIKKENAPLEKQEGLSLEKRIYQYLYILAFLGLAFWRLIRVLKVLPLAYKDDYHSNIIDAVLLLILPCVCVLYLKMRKDDDARPMDRLSRDVLNFFSYTSFFYAGVIAAAAVLKIDIMAVLKWAFYAASAYLVLSLIVNILLSMLKGDVLSFDYSLFPRQMFSKKQLAEAASKWKVSIKSLYTIRYTFKILPALALGLIFVLFFSTSVYVVQPHQQAAVYHFGRLKPSSIKEPGLHFKFPWPIDKAEIYDVRRAASLQIGYESSGTSDFLWTQRHDIGEYMLLLGNGNEMVAVNVKIVYVISDLYSYIKTCTNAEAMLSAAAYNALMTRTINTTLDSFLNVDRNSLSTSVLEELKEICNSNKLGFTVIQVVIENIHPPVDIADVYQKVVSASVDKTTAIIKAHTYAEVKVIEAAKQSKRALDGAKAVQFDRTSEAQKETAVFYAASDAYRISPGSYELTKNLEVYQKIIKGHKVYAFSRGAENSITKFMIGKFNTYNLLDAKKGEGNE